MLYNKKQLKPKLNKQVNTYTKQRNKIKGKNERKEVRTYTSKQKLFWLNFDRSPQSNQFTTKQKLLVNFKTRGSRPEKVPIKIRLT